MHVASEENHIILDKENAIDASGVAAASKNNLALFPEGPLSGRKTVMLYHAL